MKMKKKSGATAKKAAAKPRPAAKKAAPPKKVAAKAASPAPAASASPRSRGAYTPGPVQGIGWAPFRYPLT